MARKDPKGRVLRRGEGYRPDKDLYIYQYMDPLGQQHTLYAKTLVELRRKEDEVTRDRLDNIRTYVAGRTTLNYAYDRYIALKYDLKPTTKANYNYMYDHFVRDTIGKRLLKDIKYSDIKYFYYQLMNEWGVKPITVDNVHTVLHPVSQMGVRDGIIRINPASGVMTEIKRSRLWDKGTRHALTVDQTTAFVDYTENHPQFNHWLTLFAVFFGTGMRVSEVCGLRWEDVDFEKREISVNHNLVYSRWDGDGGKETFHITTPKTAKGTRIIPMMDEVYEALQAEYAHQKETGFCTAEVDGMKGFIFRNRFGGVLHQGPINKAIKRVYTSYNDEELLNAAKAKRKPLLIPHFSCHHMRHTFCTRLCERETNIKAIQEIMGHADVQTTLNIYAEATDEVKHAAIESLQTGKDIF
jgi:integrase